MDVHDLITTYKQSESNDKHIAVFYLHGGGLLYGERDDLPLPYIELLTKAGYTVIAADYPLAPESALPDIMAAITATFRETVLEPTQAGEFDGFFPVSSKGKAPLPNRWESSIFTVITIWPMGPSHFRQRPIPAYQQ